MSTEVAKSEKKPTQLANVKGWIESPEFKDQIARALPKHMTADRFLRVAITATMRTPKLLQCTQASLLRCLLDLSQLGLEADGRRAHLIPFENRKMGCVECTLIVDYKGLAELVLRSGLVSVLHADVIREGDIFEYSMGKITKHVPWFLRTDAGKPKECGNLVGAYATCENKDGTAKSEVMSIADINSIRSRSRSADSGPWVSDFCEMGKKTVFKRLSKWLVLSPEIREVIDREDREEERLVSLGRADAIQTTATKSDAVTALLKSRQTPTETNEPEGDSDTESETTIDPKLMTQFNKLNQWIAIQPGVESVALEDAAPISEWKLPNGGFLLIGTKDSLPESPDEATSVVDVGDAKSFDKLKQIIKASQPQE